jgi:sulfofructose kinase
MPAPIVTAVDTLAAGDVWHGAFTLALAEASDVRFGKPLCERRRCNQVLEERGSAWRADREEVMRLLAGAIDAVDEIKNNVEYQYNI